MVRVGRGIITVEENLRPVGLSIGGADSLQLRERKLL